MHLVKAYFRKKVLVKVFKYFIFLTFLYLILLCNRQQSNNFFFIRKSLYIESVNDKRILDTHDDIVDNYFKRRMIWIFFINTITFTDSGTGKDSYYFQAFNNLQDWPTSNLGTLLFKNIPINTMPLTHAQENKTYKILIWKYWNILKERHVYSYSSKTKVDPLQECSVKNCKFSGDHKTISSADAVIVHVPHGLFPNTTFRNPKQRWIFLNDEPPPRAFISARYAPNIADLTNMFNWSMTYRRDSDVPVPYGRTMPLKTPILNQITDKSLSSYVPYWNKKRTDVLVSILMSNCKENRRNYYLQKLQEHLTVDIYGKCSKDKKNSCPGHYRSDCKVIKEYLFYLVFENSECDEYLTEKLFYNAYSNGAIPVIMGPTVDSCETLLPPESFLHVDDFNNSKELAKHMIEISKNSSKLLAFHRWRNHFYVANEHGYFGTKSYHLCRICEALNYNDQEVKYFDEESLRIFLDPTLTCRN